MATSHLHQIVQHMSRALGPRDLREVETLSEVMDQLAAGQFGQAVDVATQRYKDIEVAMQDGDWKRASHLELLPDAQRLLTGRDEQELITRELRHEMRLRQFLDEGRAPGGKARMPRARAKKQANTRTRGKDARIPRASPKGLSSGKGNTFEEKAFPA